MEKIKELPVNGAIPEDVVFQSPKGNFCSHLII